jgi:hypothetical protein
MTADRPFPASAESERWLSIYEVAGQLLARPETVKAWVREGLLESTDRGRLGIRIPAHAVEDFIRTHLRIEGFRSADHSLGSGSSDGVLTATEVPEQAIDRQGAGWPFRRDDS